MHSTDNTLCTISTFTTTTSATSNVLCLREDVNMA